MHSGHRRQQVWDASALRPAPGLLKTAPVEEDFLELPPAWEGEEVVFDFASTGLTLRSHPVALLREQLSGMKLRTAAELKIIAAILEQPAIEKILTHLGLQVRAPPRAPARGSRLQAPWP